MHDVRIKGVADVEASRAESKGGERMQGA